MSTLRIGIFYILLSSVVSPLAMADCYQLDAMFTVECQQDKEFQAFLSARIKQLKSAQYLTDGETAALEAIRAAKKLEDKMLSGNTVGSILKPSFVPN